jgi:hypothetical protein
MNEKEFKVIKAEADKAKTDSERAKGAFDEAMKTLSTEFGVEDLPAAKAKIKQSQKAADKAQTEFETALSDYKKKWETE